MRIAMNSIMGSSQKITKYDKWVQLQKYSDDKNQDKDTCSIKTVCKNHNKLEEK